MRDIVLSGIHKSFDGKVVLKDLSLIIPSGSTTCFMAPSGYGKTTLLRLLMGLISPDAGTIVGLEDLRMSTVFQEDRLAEHLSAVANIRLVSPSLTEEQVLEALEVMKLEDSAHQMVRELSGGMRRRVTLLRALLSDYDLLLLDEPFKGLDEETKQLVIEEAKTLTQGSTVLLVTHELAEAVAFGADSIVRLSDFT